MQLIRLLRHNYVHPVENRFVSEAFKNYGGAGKADGGFSVVEWECVERMGKSVCAHLGQYYPGFSRDGKTFFFRFDSSLLPPGHSLVQTPSDTGDDCHHDIRGVSDKTLKSWFKKAFPGIESFLVCAETGEIRPMTEADLLPYRQEPGQA